MPYAMPSASAVWNRRKIGRRGARFHSLAYQVQGWLSMMQGWGSIRRKAEKKLGVKGGAALPCKI